jgi:hypothetical protein
MTLRYLKKTKFDPYTHIKETTFSIQDTRDFTTNDVSLNKYDNGQYDELINDMNTALHTIGYSDIYIFTDASGMILANDSSGNPIEKRRIKSTSYTYPYIDASDNFVFGYFTIVFDDDNTFTLDDEHHTSFWYVMFGMNPIVVKQLT